MFLSNLQKKIGGRNSLRRQLVRGGIGISALNLINRLLILMLAIVLSRELGAEGYGIYAYALALMNLLLIFSVLGMPTLLVREIAANQVRQNWPCFRGLLLRSHQIVFVMSFVVAGSAGLVLWLLSDEIAVNQRETIYIMIALLPLVTLRRTMMGVLRGMQHVVKSKAVELLYRPALTLLGVGILFTLIPSMRTPQYAMAIQLAATAVALLIAAILLYRYIPHSVYASTPQYKTGQWLSSAIPLTLFGATSLINNQTDILMLGIFRPIAEVGIYSVATQGAMLVAFGLQAANAVIAPQIARFYAQGDQVRLQKLLTASGRVIFLFALPVALVFIIAGGTLVGWVFGAEFAQSHMSLAILAFGQLVNASMGAVVLLLNMTGHERDVVRIFLITGGVNVVLNLLLIPLLGMEGAASATAFSLILSRIMLYRIVKNRLGVNSIPFVRIGHDSK